MPDFYRMQLHPDWKDCAVEFAEGVLQKTNKIGLDFDLGGDILQDKSLDQWAEKDFTQAINAHVSAHKKPGPTNFLNKFYGLKKGDIVLIQGGGTPVALVEISGSYVFNPKTHTKKAIPNPSCAGKNIVYWDWFRHGFPIKIIGWYSKDKNGYSCLSDWSPPSQGAFQPLIKDSPTLRALHFWVNIKKQDKNMQNLKTLLNTSNQIILSGPPGTSKTWQAKRLAAELLSIKSSEVDKEENNQDNEFTKAQYPNPSSNGAWAIIQFHPAYNYEDFVRGIQVSTPIDGGSPQYTTVNRIFAQIALIAHDNPEKTYVLIIDEINRAHLAAVLGELIYGLEYRGSIITSPYAVNTLSEQFDNKANALIVPPNLYIIGTMNTADRSIGHIDYAVRRRFAFVPLLPDESVLHHYYTELNNPLYEQKAKNLFKAVQALFKGDVNCLSPEFHADDVQPGHTYFMAESCEQLANKFIYQVYPLLREYVKDGILVIKDNNLIVNNIKLEPVMSVSDLEEAIMDYLDCSSLSNQANENGTSEESADNSDETE